MAGINVSFKLDAKEMFRKMGNTRFQHASRNWGNKTAISLELRAKRFAPVDVGRLKSSITHQVIEMPGNVIARTGTNVHYAAYQEFGTGLYGPRKRLIRPKNAKVLRWKKRGGGFVFAKYVRGVKPKRYFTKALAAERPVAERRLDDEVKREMEQA